MFIQAEERDRIYPDEKFLAKDLFEIRAFVGNPGFAFLARPANASGPLPLIIVLGGSEGDDHTAREIAPRLASEGYAVLGFPYRSPDRGLTSDLILVFDPYHLPEVFSHA